MSADKTIEGEEKTGRRRRSNRPAELVEEQDEAVEERGVTAGKGRATPSRRRQVEEEDSGNLATRTVGGLRGYFEGVRSELEKVVWPTREEWRRLTVIVLITLIASALALGTISFIFTELFRIGLANPIILIGAMLIAVAGGFFVYRYNNRRATY
ncbi:MAG: preprotein translocase subunit SecE [Anaerolineae bacterium]|nr:preprotein translocase subunit SecE [Anaerolineae bacterium]